jgi:hypothetical protein
VPPIDQRRLAELLASARDQDASYSLRGRALEDLAELVFSAVPGTAVACSRSEDVFRSQEIDVACRNAGHPEGLQDFDHIILIECKNWASPVGAMEVAWFDTKLRIRSRTTGVLIAMNGITGDAHSRQFANAIVERALGEGRSVLVLEVDEIEHLTSGEELADLLKRKEVDLNMTLGIPRPKL